MYKDKRIALFDLRLSERQVEILRTFNAPPREGYLFITDRKNIYFKGGENVSPRDSKKDIFERSW